MKPLSLFWKFVLAIIVGLIVVAVGIYIALYCLFWGC